MAADCLARGREFGVTWQLDSEALQCPARRGGPPFCVRAFYAPCPRSNCARHNSWTTGEILSTPYPEALTPAPTCHAVFNLLVRRHHCRHCGRIFCNACTDHDLEHPLTGKLERACQGCVGQLAGTQPSPPLHAAASPAPTGEGARYGVRWKPDAAAAACGSCSAPFSTANRKHHCRFCGDVVCLKCSVNQLMHPRTRQPEKACLPCVKRFQVREAVAAWRRAPPTVTRAACAVGSTLLLLVALPSRAAAPFCLALLLTPFLWAVLGARYRQVASGATPEEFLAPYYSHAGHVYVGLMAADGVFALFAGVVALASLWGGHPVLGILLFLLASGLGACAWWGYHTAAPALRQLQTQLRAPEDEDAEL